MRNEIPDDRLEDYLRRIREVYPSLAIRQVTPVAGRGQNNAILIVNDETIFRFPLYPPGVARLERLVGIMRVVGQSVSLSVPNPVYLALDDPTPGKAFVGYPLIRGEPLWRETFEALPDEGIRQSLADQLAAFLTQLHAIPPSDVLPNEASAFDPLAQWANLYQRIRLRLFPAMRPGARKAVARHFEDFLDDPRNRAIRPALVQGDFGTSNILFDPATNRLTGVLDFDGAHVGDPAVDLAAASGYGLRRLGRTYPQVAPAVPRVEFYVGTFALQEALFGVENGDAKAFERGIAAYR